jgi:hypothetical protein
MKGGGNLLQYPTNVSPENTAKPANSTVMSFTFNGDRLSYYNIKATDMATGEKIGIGYWGEAMESHGGCPAFNGDQITMATSAQGLTDGHDYVWQVMMAQRDLAGENNLYDIPVCRGSIQSGGSGSPTVLFIDKHLPLYEWGYNGNDGKYYPTKVDDVVMAGMVIEINGERRFIENYLPADTYDQYGAVTIDSAFTNLPTTGARYQIYSNYLISPQYYFMCRALPSLTLELGYQHNPDDSLYVTGAYSQANNTPIKYYEMTLYAQTSDTESASAIEIEKSGKIFSQRLEYLFKNCFARFIDDEGEDISKVYYRVVCDMVTQDNVTYSAYTMIDIEGIDDYSPIEITHVWHPINGYGCCYDKNNAGGSTRYYRTDLNTGKTVRLTGKEVQFDFKVSTKGNYEYTTIPYNATTGQPYLRSISHCNVKTNFDGYFISALEPNGENSYTLTDTWKFICDIENTTVAQNLGNVLQVGYSKYTTMSSTEVNYMTGTLSGYVGYFNCCDHKYHDDISLVRAWREFISAPHPFLLKSQKGDVWVVNIVESPSVEYQEDYYKIPTRFTFSWAECADVDNIQIEYYLAQSGGDTSIFEDSEQYRCARDIPDEYDPTSEADYIYTIENGKAIIIAYIGNYKNPQIPNTLNGKIVTQICSTAFYEANINTVCLPDNIQIIE